MTTQPSRAPRTQLEAIALGAVIREARERKTLTQEQAAAKCGYTQSEWSRIERGTERDLYLSTVLAVARALQLHPATLFTRAMRKLTTSHTSAGTGPDTLDQPSE